jgi:membrane protease subunit (stomatin/prohibitin family)
MRMKRELTNIQIGPQDDALFEIPEGYNSMMMGMGAGMLGIPGMSGAAEEPAAGEEGAAQEGEEQPKKKGFGLGTLKGVLDAVQ